MNELCCWVDRNAERQIVNQVIMEESINEQGWAERVKEKLLKYGIRGEGGIGLTIGTIRKIKRELFSGKRQADGTSSFSGRLYNSLSARSGKDIMYGQLDLLTSTLNKKLYVGLPANQVLHNSSKYEMVNAFELNKDMFNFMKHTTQNVCNVKIFNKDIVKYLLNTEDRFSIFDLDLMVFLDQNKIDNICNGINNSGLFNIVVLIASCIGRKITEEEYLSYDFEKILKQKYDIEIHYSKKYRDAVIPMRYELFKLRKKKMTFSF
jgi:hypothetical protein